MHQSPLVQLFSSQYSKNEMQEALLAMFASNPVFFVNKKNVKAKIFNIKDTDNILVVLRDDKIEVYRENSYPKKAKSPFVDVGDVSF